MFSTAIETFSYFKITKAEESNKSQQTAKTQRAPSLNKT